MKQYRQGDILIEEIDTLPVDVKEEERVSEPIVLAYGETTGHMHAITDLHVKAFLDSSLNGTRYLHVYKQAFLNHQEHDTIQLPSGFYRVTRQREYRPEGSVNVAD